MSRKILVADLLCGAGGSSTGCERALRELGLEMELVCVNHWGVAIETHRLNHPEARHYVQDIATVRPHLLVPEGYLDLLMASPTCTHHSVARGGKPTSDQQRSDPWHIITWLTELRVKRIIIENVWEFCGWGPVNPKTGKPIKERKGEYFYAWIETLRRLGFDPEWRKLNAADYGDATTRQRFILMARSDGRQVHWPKPTHTKRPDQDMALFPGMHPWKPAREIIDWDIKGKSIFNRKKPLAPKTLERIYAGAVKFKWPEPYLVILRQHMAGQSLERPLPTIAAGGQHIGLAEPVIGNLKKATSPSAMTDPLPTQSTHASLFTAQPIILANRNNNTAKDPGEDPVPCLTTSPGGGIAVAEPVIFNGRKNNHAKGVSDEPIPTLDTKGAVWLAEPMVLSQHNTGAARSADDPLPALTTGGAGAEQHPGCARPMLIEPFILSQASGGAPREVAEPIPTAPCGGAHALISAYYSSGSGETCTSDAEPLPTATAKNRFGIVVPVTHVDGANRARDVETDPLPTLTTASRGELAFITAQHGERPGQAPRVHSVDDPAPTVAATGHVDLVEGAEGYDILFRMLEPHELAAAMGFTSEEQAYEFAGTKTDQIKQIGNAVSVAKMKACVGAIMADAVPRRRASRDDSQEEAA